MSSPSISLNIEGEFIDSFIYSGSLFLVGIEGSLKTYRWNELVHRAVLSAEKIHQRSILSLLTDSRVQTDRIYDELGNHLNFTFNIDAKSLSEHQSFSIDLTDLPTDLNIFSNRLFIASESGVESRKFDWKVVGHVKEFESPLLIWDEMSFKVSPNSMNRVAIAAGKSGLLTAAPHAHVTKKSDLNQIIDVPCSDCDWQESILVASTNNGCIRADFESDSSEHDSLSAVNTNRRTPPKSVDTISINDSKMLFTWLGGDRIFSIDEKLNLYSKVTHLNAQFKLLEKHLIHDTAGNSRLYAIRSSIFGTLAEFSNALLRFSEAGVSLISKSPGRWRVFPRAKNYANHLHVVEDNCLRVLVFNTNQNVNGIDRFGFALDSLSENDNTKL